LAPVIFFLEPADQTQPAATSPDFPLLVINTVTASPIFGVFFPFLLPKPAKAWPFPWPEEHQRRAAASLPSAISTSRTQSQPAEQPPAAATTRQRQQTGSPWSCHRPLETEEEEAKKKLAERAADLNKEKEGESDLKKENRKLCLCF
jgi:hypothetical protein